MSFVHKQSCIDAFAAFERQVQDWESLWPKYCKKCLGVGGIEQSGDWVPYGSTNVQTPGWTESCWDCIQSGWCARCGNDLFNSDGEPIVPYSKSEDSDADYVVCLTCGWTENPKEQTFEMVHPRVSSHPTGEGPCECELEFMQMAEEEYRNRGL